MNKLHDLSALTKTKVPSAVTFVRKLNGASQPAIVMTTGASLYVVKLFGFGGPLALMKEAIGTELMRRMGLPVPGWSPILMTDEFIERNPQLWFRTAGGGVIRPKAGLHFGSRLVLSGNGHPTYELVPSLWRQRIENPEALAGAIVADLWMNNCDRRQMLFLDTGHGLLCVFIDQDHLFGGILGDEQANPRRLMAYNAFLFGALRKRAIVDRWIRAVDRVNRTWFESTPDWIPSAWSDTDELAQTREILLRRHARLNRLIDEATDFLAADEIAPQATARYAAEPRMSFMAGLGSAHCEAPRTRGHREAEATERRLV